MSRTIDPRKVSSHTFLLVSFLLSLLVSALLAQLLIPNGLLLEEAQSRGYWGKALLEGYSKPTELGRYIFVVILTLLLSFTALFIWRRGKTSERPFESEREGLAAVSDSRTMNRTLPSAQRRSRLVRLVGIPMAILVLTWAPELFWKGGPYWMFAVEQGEHLAWMNELRSGALMYRDVFVHYGPLMEYPLALLSTLMEPSILTLRVYVYVLNIVSYLIFYFLALTYLRRPALAAIAALVFLTFVFSTFPGMNGSPSRVALALFPILLLGKYLQSSQRLWLFATGVGVGASLLYSQEYGIASLAANSGALILYTLRQKHVVSRLIRDSLTMVGGVAVSFAPFLTLYATQESLLSFFSGLREFSQTRLLGSHAASPYPNLMVAMSSLDLKELLRTLRFYLPPILYLVVLVNIGYLLARRSLNGAEAISSSLAIFGLIAFPAVIAKASVHELFANASPAILLVLRYSISLSQDIRVQARSFNNDSRRAIFSALQPGVLLALLAGCGLLFLFSGPAREHLLSVNISKLNGHWLPSPSAAQIEDTDLVALDLPRAQGIFVEWEWADEVARTTRYIQGVTAQGETVFIFPSAPIYYFLADRRLTTRYVSAYFAPSHKDRAEMLRDLEKNPPQYILWERRWNDPVPPEVQIPDLLVYVQRNYALTTSIGKMDVMHRK